MAEFDDYAWLTGTTAAAILTDLAAEDRAAHRQIRSLRKSLSAERTRLAVQQVELRAKGREKFGAAAAQMFFLPTALEQATDLWIARYKAQRFPAGQAVTDFCCGIGGDLAALAERSPVYAWDRDPVAVLFAKANLQQFASTPDANVAVDDILSHPPQPTDLWHLDPDRRAQGGRTTRLDAYSPNAEVIGQWLDRAPAAAIKLAPATAYPAAGNGPVELEWISRARRCRQLVVWSGPLASCPGQRRASRVDVDPSGNLTAQSFTAEWVDTVDVATRPQRYLFDPDPALVAAGLVTAVAQQHDLCTLGAGSVFLTGQRVVDQPLLTPFEVCAELPLKPRAVGSYLQERQVGRVEIKVRGVDVDPPQLRRQLKLDGPNDCVLIATRIGRRKRAVVCRRPTGSS